MSPTMPPARRRDPTITLAVTLLCLVLAIGLAVALVLRAAALEIELLETPTAEQQPPG